MTQTVVVGVDGSESALRALDWACHEAASMKADLDIVHVSGLRHPLHDWLGKAGGPAETAAADRVLDDALARCPDLTARTDLAVTARRVKAGTGRISPAPALTETSREADLLVLGAVGAGGARERLLGSTALRCASWSSCPVVVVRDGPPQVRTIMVALDDSPAGREALRWGAREATLHTAALHVVHVVWPPEWPGHSATEIADAARRMVEYNLEQAAISGRVTSKVVTPERSAGTDPGRVLVEESSGMDLVVCGALGFGAGQFFGEIVDEATSRQAEPSDREIGSTAHHVLLHGPSHVAVVHAPRENLLELRMRFDRERDWTASRTPPGATDEPTQPEHG